MQNLLTVVVYIGVGCAFFGDMYGWSFVETLYFAATTCTTVGYGDFSIVNNARHEMKSDDDPNLIPSGWSVLFAIVYLVLGLLLIWPILSSTALDVVTKFVDFILEKFDDTPDDGERDIDDQIVIALCLILFCLLSGALFLHVC